jgi:hypothetical protein
LPVEGGGGISAAKSRRIFLVTSSSNKSVDGYNIFFAAFNNAELLFLMLVLLCGLYLDFESLDSFDLFYQLYCILKLLPFKKKLIYCFFTNGK